MSANYFQTYRNYFWEWQEGGEVIAIPEGNTIVYRPLVQQLINRLSVQGLPPFGALLLTISSLNPRGEESLSQIKQILERNLDIADYKEVQEAFDLLFLLSSIPDEYKKEEGKAILLTALFQNAHNAISTKESKSIAKGYSDSFDWITTHLPVEDITEKRMLWDFRTLAIIGRKCKTKGDVLTLMGGVPELEETLALEEAQDEPETLVEALCEDVDTYKVGALVPMLWSGLKLPYHSTQSSEQPLGGVSNLTNKGDLSRLLISEFAYDDLTFLSRLANQESLYLNRETPPNANNQQRFFLIDVSIRNWGVPKIMAFAAAVAIAEHPKTDISCQAFLVGDELVPIDLNSKEGIIKAIQRVHVSDSAAGGMEAFFDSDYAKMDAEVFLMTESDAANAPTLSKAIADHRDKIHYWVLTDETGGMDVYKKTRRSRKHLQRLQLPLEQLWSGSKKFKKTNQRQTEDSERYPILFDVPLNFKALRCTSDKETFILTKERNILRFFKRGAGSYERGWEFFYGGAAARGRDFEMGLTESGDYVSIAYLAEKRMVVLTNFTTGEEKRVGFGNYQHGENQAFIFFDDQFVHVTSGGVWMISLNGEIGHSKVVDDFIQQKVKSVLKLNNEKSRRFWPTGSVLKNVKTVRVSSEGSLLFNDHELILNQANQVKLKLNKSVRELGIYAEEKYPGIFEFKDGSTVQVVRQGMYVLKSSDESIPAIYIPAMLDNSLGVATWETFVGSNYFYREPLYTVSLLSGSSEGNELAFVKLLRDHSELGLTEAKRTLSLLGKVPCLYYLHEVEEAAQSFEQLGATTRIDPVDPEFTKPLTKVATTEFFNQYIEPYLAQIMNYGD